MHSKVTYRRKGNRKMKFDGNYKDLEKVIIGMERDIIYSVSKDNMHQIKTSSAEVINLLKNGHLFIQAEPKVKEKFKFDYHYYNHYLFKDPSLSVSK